MMIFNYTDKELHCLWEAHDRLGYYKGIEGLSGRSAAVPMACRAKSWFHLASREVRQQYTTHPAQHASLRGSVRIERSRGCVALE